MVDLNNWNFKINLVCNQNPKTKTKTIKKETFFLV
jgi:hypothetical protein